VYSLFLFSNSDVIGVILSILLLLIWFRMTPYYRSNHKWSSWSEFSEDFTQYKVCSKCNMIKVRSLVDA
jgi:hypothetical protein